MKKSGSCRVWGLGLHKGGAWDYILIEGVDCGGAIVSRNV